MLCSVGRLPMVYTGECCEGGTRGEGDVTRRSSATRVGWTDARRETRAVGAARRRSRRQAHLQHEERVRRHPRAAGVRERFLRRVRTTRGGQNWVADVETRRRERFVNSLCSCRLRARSKAARRTATERGRTWSARPRSYATRWSYIRTASRRRVIALGDARATPAVGAAKMVLTRTSR
eukprot:20195-Pelagococcus_subviridis.AAC.1